MHVQKNVQEQKPLRRLLLCILRKKPLVEEAKIAQTLLDAANCAISEKKAGNPAYAAWARKGRVSCAQRIFGNGYRLVVDYGFKHKLAGIVVDISASDMGTALKMRAGRMKDDCFFYSTYSCGVEEIAQFEKLLRAEIYEHSQNLRKYPVSASDLDGLATLAVPQKRIRRAFAKAALAALALSFAVWGCCSSEKPSTDSRPQQNTDEVLMLAREKGNKAEQSDSIMQKGK
ncbi:MAG: hypothetical protein N3E51_02720 [Candidatus Micrarchaeota archaeon]|nr:hypothetical protein [Candidatus Micrarchaeota archaeon]